MSGGVAYVLDPESVFPAKCNMGMVGLETISTPEEAATVRGYIESHVKYTGSIVAQEILADWENQVGKFVKVMPQDYKRVLEEEQQEEELGLA